MTFILPMLAAGIAAAAPSERLALGERIYRQGVLPSGQPLRAVRSSGEVTGPEAACVLCHRRSGLGNVEGDRLVPPIAGQFLFSSRAAASAEMDARHTRGPDLAHAFGRERPRPPYTEASLLEAIRTGQSSSGAMLDPLMPRYELQPEDGRLLVGYLRQLSTSPSPGVTTAVIRLATVIAPGVAPERRMALVDVLQGAVALHNASVKLEQLRDRSSPGSAHARYRQWELALWDLTGPAASWDAQLQARYRRKPVFALLSGLSEGDWSPVERFGERMGIPVWFPTVDLPALGEGEFYSAYFTEGVKLEAAVLARQIRALGGVSRVVQLHGPTAAEESGARALGERLQGASLTVESRRVDPDQPAGLRAALSGARPEDAVVLWLRPGALRLLTGIPAPPGQIYASGLLGNGERAPLPADWKRSARLVYPFELPERRRASAARFQPGCERGTSPWWMSGCRARRTSRRSSSRPGSMSCWSPSSATTSSNGPSRSSPSASPPSSSGAFSSEPASGWRRRSVPGALRRSRGNRGAAGRGVDVP